MQDHIVMRMMMIPMVTGKMKKEMNLKTKMKAAMQGCRMRLPTVRLVVKLSRIS